MIIKILEVRVKLLNDETYSVKDPELLLPIPEIDSWDFVEELIDIKDRAEMSSRFKLHGLRDLSIKHLSVVLEK